MSYVGILWTGSMSSDPSQKSDQEELKQLRALRHSLDLRIKRLESRMTEPNPGRSPSVSTEKLCSHIQKWIDSGKSLVALADEAMVDEKTIRTALKGQNISERSVDRIVVALGLPHLYDDIVPLPPPSQYYED